MRAARGSPASTADPQVVLRNGRPAQTIDRMSDQPTAPENLIHRLIPHQGCVITPTADGVDIAGSAMNWVMSAGVLPFVMRPPFAIRVIGKTDSTNLRLHWHRGEVIFNWECNVRELRVHDPATGEQHAIKDKGFLATNEWHEIVWEIAPRRICVIADDEILFETKGDYRGLVSAPSIGPCFGSTVSIREFWAVPIKGK